MEAAENAYQELEQWLNKGKELNLQAILKHLDGKRWDGERITRLIERARFPESYMVAQDPLKPYKGFFTKRPNYLEQSTNTPKLFKHRLLKRIAHERRRQGPIVLLEF